MTTFHLVKGTAGNDTMYGTVGDDWMIAGDGNDALFAGAGNDHLDGGNGNDTLTGGDGADVLDGGDGIDTASYTGSTAGVYVDLYDGWGSGGEAQGDTYVSIENVQGSAYNDYILGTDGANTLSGNGGNDTLDGAGGNDHLNGGDGNDVLIGGTGTNWLDGGAGIDTVDYSEAVYGARVDLSGAALTQSGLYYSGVYYSNDIYSNIENINGSGWDDVLVGDAGDNVIYGNGGNDYIAGQGGNNTLFGGDGNDIFLEGTGADAQDGGAGVDTVQYTASAVGVTVNLATGVGSGGDAAGDTYVSIENVYGSNYGDTLIGNADVNYIQGNDGGDTIEGGAGGDTLIGGSGIDTVSYRLSTAAVKVDLLPNATTGAQSATGGDATGDSIWSFENAIGSAYNDYLFGSDGANDLWGSGGNDTINGRGGNDTLGGELGNDLLSGGLGSDTFVFQTFRAYMGGPNGDDFVTDYHVGEDHLEFHGVQGMSDLNVSQQGADTLITFLNGETGSITLAGVDAQNLVQHASTDFIFHWS